MKISLLITTFCRPQLLYWHLYTLSQQYLSKYDYEIIVLNDGVIDETEDVVGEFRRLGMNVRVVFTGGRNSKDNLLWRVPGFAFNIGAKIATGQILILSCSEIYHLSNTFEKIVEPLFCENLLTTPKVVHDDSGKLITFLDKKISNETLLSLYIQDAKKVKKSAFMPNPYMPYFMGMYKEEFVKIGGYDEDFIGVGGDDNDLVERLVANGNQYRFVDAEIIHLYHGRKSTEEFFADPRYQYNRKLWKDRSGTIIRNVGKEWGKFEG